MTTTYDPSHPKYFDEDDLREEVDRVFDLCHGCRMCFNYCGSFPKLFDFVDSKGQQHAKLTSEEQDEVVDACFQCKICYVKCPYIPPHEWALDFPRLMMRANAVAAGKRSLRERITDQVLARTDLVGAVSSRAAPLANQAIGTPNTPARRLLDRIAGVSPVRMLPSYSRTRFSRWFKDRLPRYIAAPRARAAVFPTCFVEYNKPRIGADIVSVYEASEIRCSLVEGFSCCGAPWLHQGNVRQFLDQAARNVEALSRCVEQGQDIVVPQPTCGYVIKRDYPLYLGTEAAARVAANTYDANEYLVKVAKEQGPLPGMAKLEAAPSVTYHAACHLQAQNAGLKGRDLLKMLGAKVTVVAKCSGIDGTWGYRSENERESKRMAAALAGQIANGKSDYVCGDCHLANTAIDEEIDAGVMYPISLVAKLLAIEPAPPIE